MDLRLSLIHTILSGEPDQEFYNCSSRTEVQWYATGKRQPYIGSYFVVSGIVFEVIYLCCLVVMSKENLLRASCYKIMFVLGIFDIISILINSIMTGYFTVIGAVYCTNPTWIFVMGAIGCGSWCADCSCCIFLALNRCYELCGIQSLKYLFHGKRVFFSLGFSFFYFFFMTFLTAPLVFNSNFVSLFFDPRNEQKPASEYENIFHSINNCFVSVTTTVIYIFICVRLLQKTNGTCEAMSKVQKQVFIQSLLICFFNVLAAYIYVWMQYFPTPFWVMLIGQIAWQWSSGSAGLIYLVFNQSIRQGVLRMLVPEAVTRRLHLGSRPGVAPMPNSTSVRS